MDNNTLQADISLINDGIKFSCKSGNNPEIITDYYPPLGNNEGYKPLELFLISFGTCVSGTVLPLLRKMRKNISGYELKIEGERKTEHPTAFRKIKMRIVIRSEELESRELEKVIGMAEEKYCPVWAMIKNNVDVETEYEIERN